MRTLILTLLFSLPVLAQHGFRAENGTIIWERTFPKSADIASVLKARPALKANELNDTGCNGIAKELDIEGQGGTALMDSKCNFDFDIAVEGGNYIVRVTNMKFLEKVGPMQLRTIVSSFEKYFMDDRKLRQTPVTQGNLQYLDNFFADVFTGRVITTSGALTSN